MAIFHSGNHGNPLTVFPSTGPLTAVDPAGPLLGGKPVLLTGPCLQEARDHLLRCRVGRAVVPGIRLRQARSSRAYVVQCVPPPALRAGTVALDLSLDGGRTFPLTTTYTYGKRAQRHGSNSPAIFGQLSFKKYI